MSAKKDDRPRFRVIEYFRTAESAPEGVDLDVIEEWLNQPSLVSYRLVGFDAGRDGA